MTEKVKNNGFCDFFFFLHGAEPLNQPKFHFFFSFIGKDLDKRSHLSQQSPPSLCVCVCECAEPPSSRAGPCQGGCPAGPQVCQHPLCTPTHTHTHTSHPGCHPRFRLFCIRLLSQYSAIANSVFVC